MGKIARGKGEGKQYIDDFDGAQKQGVHTFCVY